MALTSTGLSIKTQPEVLSDIVAAEQANIDSNINTDEDLFLGQLNQLLATAIADQQALAQAVYNNFNPDVAEGTNLDDIAKIIGVVRQDARPSSTENQAFIGTSGTTIPVSTLLENPVTGDRFTTTSTITLSESSCLAAIYSIGSVLNNTLYTLTVNGTEYDYTSDGDATAIEILGGLKALVDADGAATWTAIVDGTGLTITIETSNLLPLICSHSAEVTLDLLKSETTAESVDLAPIVAPLNSVSSLVIAISGITSTTNSLAYVLGRDKESDIVFRARILTSQQQAGTATVPAIEDAVSGVDGVTTVRTIENRTFAVDGDGRPPKSFETVVQGGSNTDVAQMLWNTKPAGIETFGTITVPVTDSNDDPQNINFTRPAAVNMAVRVTYTIYSEESFPSNGEQGIKDSVEAHVDALGVDVDVITGRMKGPIYETVSGIDTLIVEIQVLANAGDAPVGGSWTTVTQAIDFDEFASITQVDITVVGP